MTYSLVQRARELIDVELDGIKSVAESLDESFTTLITYCESTVAKGGKVVITGIGKSGHIGNKIAATLSSTGTPAVFLHPVEAMHGDLGVLSRHDVLLALSYSGETDELLAVLPAAKHFEVPIVAMTGEPDSSLARWSELTVKVRVPREACPFNLAPTSSTTALLALGDALAVILLERRGFEKSDYARLHPAGAIGRSITLRVTDIMRDGDRFACVTDTMPVREVLVTMTRARSGAVAVVDAQGYLAGIFTDGDFRRHITEKADLLERLVADVMTRNPITIDADSMAVDLINLLQERRIDDVLVVDADKRPVGVIDIQDLPKFKLM